MPHKVLLPTVLRPHVGGAQTVEAEGGTVAEVFADLSSRHPALGERLMVNGGLPSFLNVFVDDEDIRYLQGLDTPVREAAEITILPAVAGG